MVSLQLSISQHITVLSSRNTVMPLNYIVAFFCVKEWKYLNGKKIIQYDCVLAFLLSLKKHHTSDYWKEKIPDNLEPGCTSDAAVGKTGGEISKSPNLPIFTFYDHDMIWSYQRKRGKERCRTHRWNWHKQQNTDELITFCILSHNSRNFSNLSMSFG